jgi:hypothetical protein
VEVEDDVDEKDDVHNLRTIYYHYRKHLLIIQVDTG